MKDLEQQKANKLMEIEGINKSKAMIICVYGSTSPAICMNEGCNASYEYEPDSEKGFCEECGTQSCKSLGRLLGVI